MRIIVVRHGWMLALRASAAWMFALAVAFRPPSLEGLVVAFGVWALVDGAAQLVLARARLNLGTRYVAPLLGGGCGIAVGFVAMLWPAMSPAVFKTVVAIWASCLALAALLPSLRATPSHEATVAIASWAQGAGADKRAGEWLTLERVRAGAGVAAIAFGFWLLLAPDPDALAAALWIDLFAVVLGAGLMGEIFLGRAAEGRTALGLITWRGWKETRRRLGLLARRLTGSPGVAK